MSIGVTINGAESKLKSFFCGVEGDYASVEKIFANENRDPNEQKHKNWFYNYSSILKKYGLALPLKGTKNGVSVTLGLTLTDKGRAALKSSGPQSSSTTTEKNVSHSHSGDAVTLASWRDDGYALRLKHPELVIDFDVRMRKDDE